MEVDGPKRPIQFRRGFNVASNATSARLYITALSLYEAEINGQRVRDHVLAPSYQVYNYRHVYGTYDVTELVTSGENATGVTVGGGWYPGRFGFRKAGAQSVRKHARLLSLLIITNADGSKETIKSDTTWHANIGPIITSKLHDGEVYNATLEINGRHLQDSTTVHG
ncbi:bacterial alpha-L-rhamnosidase N-terminal [Zopfia rhizophila CBS 207.26]|uniref:Bacterial alpha-L-rhamnosidase N-terminal n=1 Tax=Zopfia rhizophila CBS 207.26 TaxID=1314779 RepID=A0A6A6EJI7_9PEZI|nr:bacterial alpha-L-rhamnosidase N-terminal [Zopfia rhizophila CBS 207.26]